MNQAQWQRVRAVFEQALDLPAAARDELLQREFEDDPLLRAEVERLLRAEPAARDYLTPPGEQTLAGTAAPGLLGPRPGDRFGPYELVRLIGMGGMGAVFEASQERPRRRVALKVMRSGFGSDRARQRFAAEIELLAQLHHPGIAQVYEAGQTGDLPWFAMELLDGAMPITQYASEHALPLPARLLLLRQAAAAVAHAHQRGVIHRDLKPANILVDSDGRAKVIDFGIAASTQGDLDRLTQATGTDGLLGTLAYMSPERLLHQGRSVDVRSDVYGLGVVLYELLADRSPFDLRGLPLAEACRRITDEEPPPPSSRQRRLPPELDWIALRALARDPERRYPSIESFDQDLARLQRHEPVQAAPPGLGYRLRKLLRRHRTAAAAALIVAATIAGAFASVTRSLWRAQEAEARERRGREAATVNAHRAEVARQFLLDVFATAEPGATERGKDVTMHEGLDRAAASFEQRFADDPRARAELARTIGLAYYGLGDRAAAERHLRLALATRLEHFADEREDVATLHLDLGGLLLDHGELDAAAAQLELAAPLLQQLPDSREALGLALLRANLLLERGHGPEAIAAMRAVIDGYSARHGDDSALRAHNLLGGALHEQGDLDGAEAEYRIARDGLLAQKGQDHPDTLSAQQNLALLLFSRHQSAESVTMLEEVLAGRRRMLGDDHTDTLQVMSNLGAEHYMRGELDRAIALWDEALRRLGATNPDSPLRQALLSNVATIERQRENWPRAIDLMREVLAARQRTLGPGHDKTLSIQTGLAEIYRQAGRIDEAAAEYAAALEQARQKDPEDLPNSYRAHLGLARTHRERKEFAAAEGDYRWCLDHYDAAVAACAVKSMLIRVEADLVALYDMWQRPDDAARFRSIVEDAGYRERTGVDK